MKINWELIIAIVAIIPPSLRLVTFLAAKSNSKNVRLLSERALIIAQALEETNLPGIQKKDIAVEKLIKFATELAIKLTTDQAVDYVNASVNELRTIGTKPKREEVEE